MFWSNDLDNSLSAKTGTRPSTGTLNGGPVSSRRRKNSVVSYYFRAKYIDTQIKYILLMNSSPLNYYRMQGHLNTIS